MMILATGFALLLAAFQGDVHVASGDTLVVSGTAVQLRGIDLPEATPGQADLARDQLRLMLEDQFVTCRLTGERLSGRMLGTCHVDGTDLGAELVARGIALDCERYSGGAYRALEPSGLRNHLVPSSHCID